MFKTFYIFFNIFSTAFWQIQIFMSITSKCTVHYQLIIFVTYL